MLGDRVAVWLAAAVSALAAVWLATEYGHERHLERANAAGVRGDYAGALREAQRAASGTTTAGRAHAVAAYAQLRLGRFAAASASFAAAVDADPADWTLRRDWAQTLVLLGHRAAARREMTEALRLNPRLRLPPMFARSARGGP